MKAIMQVIRNVPGHWVGDGFPVRSLFSYQEGEQYDPFLLLDYAGPHEFPPSQEKRGVGGHPHRGFETVTIVYQGELEHRDSTGSSGTIGPGDVQWMTAASGVVHEEFHSARFSRQGGTLEMVQLWVNLPARDKATPPKYQEILSSQIPSVTFPAGGGQARVIAGTLEGVTGPAQTFTPMNVWDLRLSAGKKTTLQVPDGDTALFIVQRGDVTVNGSESVQAVELIRFDRSGTTIEIEPQSDAMGLLLSGRPIGEPVVGRGPFVMNTQEEIRQSIINFQSGKMGFLD